MILRTGVLSHSDATWIITCANVHNKVYSVFKCILYRIKLIRTSNFHIVDIWISRLIVTHSYSYYFLVALITLWSYYFKLNITLTQKNKMYHRRCLFIHNVLVLSSINQDKPDIYCPMSALFILSIIQYIFKVSKCIWKYGKSIDNL